ncbi:hypothetical protein pb186bvf_001934 [Paramecium bursaria]
MNNFQFRPKRPGILNQRIQRNLPYLNIGSRIITEPNQVNNSKTDRSIKSNLLITLSKPKQRYYKKTDTSVELKKLSDDLKKKIIIEQQKWLMNRQTFISDLFDSQRWKINIK